MENRVLLAFCLILFLFILFQGPLLGALFLGFLLFSGYALCQGIPLPPSPCHGLERRPRGPDHLPGLPANRHAHRSLAFFRDHPLSGGPLCPFHPSGLFPAAGIPVQLPDFFPAGFFLRHGSHHGRDHHENRPEPGDPVPVYPAVPSFPEFISETG